MKVATVVLLAVSGVAIGVAIAEVAPAQRAPATATATATVSATASAPRATPRLRATQPAETFDRVDENGEPIIQIGRFAGWTQRQWREYYGDRLDQMWRELNDTEQMLARTCADDDRPCRDAIANARVQVRDLRLRIDRDEQDLASVVDAR